MDRLTLTHSRKCLDKYGSVVLICASNNIYFYKKELPKARVRGVGYPYIGVDSPVIVAECAFNAMSEEMLNDVEDHNDRFSKKWIEMSL